MRGEFFRVILTSIMKIKILRKISLGKKHLCQMYSVGHLSCHHFKYNGEMLPLPSHTRKVQSQSIMERHIENDLWCRVSG